MCRSVSHPMWHPYFNVIGVRSFPRSIGNIVEKRSSNTLLRCFRRFRFL